MNRYSKQQCLDKDWSNRKEISTKELAYCIVEYGLKTDDIPENRRVAVNKEIVKIQERIQNKETRRLIKMELAHRKHIFDDALFTNYNDNYDEIEYYLDPDLFETQWEAIQAMDELSSCEQREMIKTEEYDHEYKNPRTYSRDIKRMIDNMDKVRKQYVKLGGNEAEFNKYVSQIPTPKLQTLKQDIYTQHESIMKRFISNGVSPSRANKIATAITQKAYQALK